MFKDAKFSCVESGIVHSNVVHSNEIHVEKLYLVDKCIESDVHMAGSRIKKLYESQQNTNPFTDANQVALNELESTFVIQEQVNVTKPAYIKFSDIKSNVPENSYTYCLDTHSNVVMKANIGGKVQYYKVPLCGSAVQTQLDIGNDNVRINVCEKEY